MPGQQVNVRVDRSEHAELIREIATALRQNPSRAEALVAALRATLAGQTAQLPTGDILARLEALERDLAAVRSELAGLRYRTASSDEPRQLQPDIADAVQAIELAASQHTDAAQQVEETSPPPSSDPSTWFIGSGPGRRLTVAGRDAIYAEWSRMVAEGKIPTVVGVAKKIGCTTDTARDVLRKAGVRLRRG